MHDGACAPPAGGRRGTGIEAVPDAEARLVESKGSAVSHDQTAGVHPESYFPLSPPIPSTHENRRYLKSAFGCL